MAGTRRRGAALLAAIHGAALAEVAEAGLGRLTMDGIARRAAVARSSLYRRWDTPGDLLLDAIAADYPREEPTGSGRGLRGDLVAALEVMLEWGNRPSIRAVQAILAERERYPELAGALEERVYGPAGRRFTATVLAHHAAEGAFDAARITPVVEDIGEALVVKHLLDTGVAPTRAHLEAIVDQAILPALGVAGPR